MITSATPQASRAASSDPIPEPEKGFYYRSDHFNFAKTGRAGARPAGGDRLTSASRRTSPGASARTWTLHDYHKPSDTVKRDWDLSGAREDLKVFFAVGYRVAEAETFPAWRDGHEFKAKRDAMFTK